MPAAVRTRDLPGVKGRREQLMIDPTQIVVEKGWNPRIDFSGEEELMTSIKTEGILENLTVKRGGLENDQFILRNGERRLRAVLKLIKSDPEYKNDGVPCVVQVGDKSDIDELITAMIKNDGKPFVDTEEAAAYKRLKDAGLTNDQIAVRVMKSEGHVRNRLLLVEAAPAVQKAVAKGEINSTQALKLVRKHKDDQVAQTQAVAEVKEKAVAKAQAKAAGTPTQARRTAFEIALAAANKCSIEDLDKLIEKLRSISTKSKIKAKKAALDKVATDAVTAAKAAKKAERQAKKEAKAAKATEDK